VFVGGKEVGRNLDEKYQSKLIQSDGVPIVSTLFFAFK